MIPFEQGLVSISLVAIEPFRVSMTSKMAASNGLRVKVSFENAFEINTKKNL